MLLAVLVLSVVCSFSQNATRALFLLPDAKPAAFAAVVQPEAFGVPDGRGGRRLIAARRGGPTGARQITLPPPAPPAAGLIQDPPTSEGGPGTLQNASDSTGGRGGGGGGPGPGFPNSAPLAFAAPLASPSPSSTTTPVEITPAVPEPPAWLLGLGGLALLGLMRLVRQRPGQASAATAG